MKIVKNSIFYAMDKDEVRYTKGDYKRLSNRIRTNPKEISNKDYEMLQALRLTYKEPLAIVFDSLYKIAHKVNENSICTYRIKRIESIISKLIRFLCIIERTKTNTIVC